MASLHQGSAGRVHASGSSALRHAGCPQSRPRSLLWSAQTAPACSQSDHHQRQVCTRSPPSSDISVGCTSGISPSIQDVMQNHYHTRGTYVTSLTYTKYSIDSNVREYGTRTLL